jgi:murein DD-endopeptidase MepM/ murein hydrolase activator NlpD
VRSAAALAIVVVLLVSLGPSGSSAVTTAVSKGRNGWFWPTGTTSVGSMGGWMDYRSWHLAKDIGAPYRSPVYALTDGVVFSAYSDLDGYGPGGGHGGAMVVLFRREDGAFFKALYGHLYGLKYSKGQAVKAGAVLGYINNSSPNHLHFGIHPGAALPTDPEHNPFRGHTYVKNKTYGWTDPIAFLEAHTPWVPPVPAALGAPVVRTPARAGALTSVNATVTPVHGPPCAVTLERWHQEGSSWVLRGSSRMSARRGSLAWRDRIVLGAGMWRLRIRFAGDLDHLPGTSAFTTVTAN